jgi:hypothetical protein
LIHEIQKRGRWHVWYIGVIICSSRTPRFSLWFLDESMRPWTIAFIMTIMFAHRDANFPGGGRA